MTRNSIALLLIAISAIVARAEDGRRDRDRTSPVAATREAVPFSISHVSDASTSGVVIRMGDVPVAEYTYRDPQILRPHFRHLRTRSGTQVTRTQPPVPEVDLDDHPTMHPGLWLAFGDLGGGDFWRNKGVVQHVRFLEEPTGGPDAATFTALNDYDVKGRVVCREECTIRVEPVASGYLLSWRSTFSAGDEEIAFGDQEEMGLGVRVATPLAVKKGGEIVSSEARRNEADVWGRQADWCTYRGTIEGQGVGITLMPHPDNFRRCWFHARDYGLLVANPFGRKAFTRGEPSRVIVKAGESLTLQFGVYVCDESLGADSDVAAVYRAYVTP
ncbi:MAG: PmoA family protein [Planctomycetaceae bacterium]|nr:PmoA family protein [Planctomycetaceae bacterium]